MSPPAPSPCPSWGAPPRRLRLGPTSRRLLAARGSRSPRRSRPSPCSGSAVAICASRANRKPATQRSSCPARRSTRRPELRCHPRNPSFCGPAMRSKNAECRLPRTRRRRSAAARRRATRRPAFGPLALRRKIPRCLQRARWCLAATHSFPTSFATRAPPRGANGHKPNCASRRRCSATSSCGGLKNGSRRSGAARRRCRSSAAPERAPSAYRRGTCPATRRSSWGWRGAARARPPSRTAWTATSPVGGGRPRAPAATRDRWRPRPRPWRSPNTSWTECPTGARTRCSGRSPPSRTASLCRAPWGSAATRSRAANAPLTLR
mmetsp:Transcript_13577/g.42244  ORF Transcript_13577/g.42244 Transcript_13577/m.42244 type:complete len:321 (-) Transcript_13577:454-1416(-)